jgi:coenzyme F420-reducing hydrogenase delta subunit
MNSNNGKNGKAGVRVYFCANSAHADEMPTALAKLELTENIALEGVPCSGKIDARYLLKAFEAGAHAVCVLACPTGDCKMFEGNLRAHRRAHAVRKLLAEAGVDPDSMQIFLPDSSKQDTLSAAVDAVAISTGRRRRTTHEVIA